MHISARTFVRSIALFAALSIEHSVAESGQEPKSAPGAPNELPTESKTSDPTTCTSARA